MFQMREIGAVSPRSFVFYIIADVGRPGTTSGHRPLAVTYGQGHGVGPGPFWACHDRVNEVVHDCASIVSVLTEPANRVALEAELALAAAWYRKADRDTDLERPEIPDAPQPEFSFNHRPRGVDVDRRPELPWADSIREFPFISTCLRLALNRYDGSHHTTRRRVGDVQEQPLETAFRNDRLEYGIVVIDISDLDKVRYGINGLQVEYLAELDLLTDIIEMGPPQNPQIKLEKTRSRKLLSGSAYMRKYRMYDCTDAVQRLKGHPIVEIGALDYIWPVQGSKERNTKKRRINTGHEAHGEAVANMMQNVASGLKDTGILEIHAPSISQPRFRAELRTTLRRDPSVLEFSTANVLLQAAYAGETHLNWVANINLTSKVMAAAISSPELQAATALSIRVDQLDDPLAPFFEALARHEAIRDVCFLEGPDRVSDDKSSRFFSQICASPLAHEIFGSKKFYLMCAFSAPLRKKTWLCPNLRSSPALLGAFPVQHMFVRQQYVASGPEEQEGKAAAKLFRPCHFFLGDSLLKPELVVTGLASYCQWILTDRYLLNFAALPQLPAGDEPAHPIPGLAISPISAENLTIPEQFPVSFSTGQTADSQTDIECWPLVQALEKDTWVLLVSHEWHTTPQTRLKREGYIAKGQEGFFSIGVPHIEYAFLRARERIFGERIDALTQQHSELIEVAGDATTFLRQAAPGADDGFAGRLFHEATRVLQERWPASMGQEHKFISLMDEDPARSVLVDFLKDAEYIKSNLKTAMRSMNGMSSKKVRTWDGPQADPLPRAATWDLWYPELLSLDTSHEPAHHRDTEMFQSIHGERPRGTERPTSEPRLPPNDTFMETEQHWATLGGSFAAMDDAVSDEDL